MVPFLRPNFLAGSSFASPTGGRGPARLFSAGSGDGCGGAVFDCVGPPSDVSGHVFEQLSPHSFLIKGQQMFSCYAYVIH